MSNDILCAIWMMLFAIVAELYGFHLLSVVEATLSNLAMMLITLITLRALFCARRDGDE